MKWRNVRSTKLSRTSNHNLERVLLIKYLSFLIVCFHFHYSFFITQNFFFGSWAALKFSALLMGGLYVVLEIICLVYYTVCVAYSFVISIVLLTTFFLCCFLYSLFCTYLLSFISFHVYVHYNVFQVVISHSWVFVIFRTLRFWLWIFSVHDTLKCWQASSWSLMLFVIVLSLLFRLINNFSFLIFNLKPKLQKMFSL